MKPLFRKRLLVSSIVALLPLAGIGQSSSRLAAVEGHYFEIVGTDQRSVSFANALGSHVVELCAGYLQAGSHAFPQRIFVALRPDDRVDFEGDYRIRIGDRGAVTLDFRWEASLSFETVCRAFAEAYVVRYSNFNYGPEANERVRVWAVSALGAQSYLSLRPAQQVQYIQQVRDSGLPAVSPLLELDLSTADQSQIASRFGYWVLFALRERGLNRSDLGVLLDQAIAGMNVAETLETIIAPAAPGQPAVDLEAWWLSQMDTFLSLDYDQYETMDVSRDWIDELTDFDIYRAEGGELGNLRTLWTHRNDAALRSVLSARSEIIRFRLERVNPAYFNAARSLGALYETTLEAGQAHEFIHAFASYLSDSEDTKRLHEKTHALLDAE